MIHELELFVQDKLDDSKPHLAKVISVLAENQSGGARRLWERRPKETPQITACLRRLLDCPRQASNRIADSVPKRHEPMTHGW
ncbi:hypothetical protein ABWW58_07545 [Sporolactobacillus sp. STCC-11]|uniref:hypothetical protein n=1 Tax=Sporolactobacillus caesalpiniae TaxID=3230362 RepID=UPI0033915593